MPRVLFAHAHQGDAVRAALRRQIEVDDLRKLLLQNRHEHFVQRHAEHRRLVRRTPGVGAVIDGRVPVGDALDGENGKRLHLVVVTGVVAEGPLGRGVARMDMPLEHELGAGRNLQITDATVHQLGARAAEESGESEFGERVRHRRHRRQHGCRIRAQRHRHGKGSAGMLFAPLAVIQRAAAVGEPAHDHAVPVDYLLPVNAQVLPRAVGPPRHNQTPSDERPGIFRPAGLDRQR